MVENLEEWVADWVPQTTACGRWNNRTSPTGRLISALPVRAPPVTRMRCCAAARGNSPRGAVRSRSVDNRRRTTVSASASAARGSHARVGPFAVCTLVSRGWAASSRRPAGAVRAARVSERHGLTRLVPIDNGSTTPRSRLAKSARGTVERDAAVKAVEASHVLPHDGSEQRPLIRVLVVGAERASNLQVPPFESGRARSFDHAMCRASSGSSCGRVLGWYRRRPRASRSRGPFRLARRAPPC